MKVFGPEYWDKYGVYRAPMAFNLCLVVLLRPYLIWAIAAASRQPDLDLMSIFYQSKHDFFIALALASGAVLTSVIFSLRRPTSSPKLAKVWRYMRIPMIISACLDLAWLIGKAQLAYYQFSGFIAVQIVLVIWVILYLLRSRYLSHFFNDWPDPETDKRQ